MTDPVSHSITALLPTCLLAAGRGWRAGQGEAGPGASGPLRGLHPHSVSQTLLLGSIRLGLCASVPVGMATLRFGWLEAKWGSKVSRSLLLQPQHYQAPQECAGELFADKLLVNGEELQ